MPVAVLERDETGTTDSGNWLDTGGASLGEQLAEALGTVRLLVAAREALAGQRYLAVGAREALTVPRFVLVGHAAARDDLLALDAAGRVLLLVAAGAVDFLLARDERLGADGRFADAAAEALLVPLSGLVLHLLGSWCRVTTIAQHALDPQVTAEVGILLGRRSPRQEHTEHGNVLALFLGPLDPFAADGFRLEAQPAVKVGRQDVGGHVGFCVKTLILRKFGTFLEIFREPLLNHSKIDHFFPLICTYSALSSKLHAKTVFTKARVTFTLAVGRATRGSQKSLTVDNEMGGGGFQGTS